MAVSHVFDTYAKTAQGKILHFDVLLAEQEAAKALAYAKAWLASIGEGDAQLDQRNCIFCHSAETPAALQAEIDQQGYAIYKMEGCPK